MVIKAQSTSKSNNNSSNIGCIEEDYIEEDGIVEGNIDNGKILSTFIFGMSATYNTNELKSKHPDVNVLFNTIVDMAISHYYDYMFNEKGTFDNQE